MDVRIAAAALAAVAVCMLIGAAAALAVRALVGRGLYAPHAELLGKALMADDGGTEREHRVVAVSRRGAVAVRPADEPGRPARWINPEKALETVFWIPKRRAKRC